MDTLKVLLGATVALLIGALAMSLKSLKEGVGNELPEKVAEHERQITAMRAELDLLKELRIERLKGESSEPETESRDEVEAKLREAEERARLAEVKAAQAADEAERAEKEAGYLTERDMEKRNKSARRARVIGDAMLIARISQWQEDPNFGGNFAILEVVSQENVQPGTVLAIRRNGGILGKLEVTDVSIEGAVASPVTAFKEVQPEPGDELILDEVVKLAN